MNRPTWPTLRLAQIALLAAHLGASSPARAEIQTPPRERVPTPSESDFHGIDFDLGAGYRDDLDRRSGPLGPAMSVDGLIFRYISAQANSVSVVGDFNDWDPSSHPLERRDDDLWRLTLPLDDGGWRYLFVVDGRWVVDPENPVRRNAPESLTALLKQQGADDLQCSYLRIENEELLVPRPAGFHETRAVLTGTYDRVNQGALFGGLAYDNPVELHPELEFGLGYAFGRERWLYKVGAVQPFFGNEVLDLGVAAYRRNATADADRVGDVENTLAALFFREDWRDYYEAEGFSSTFGLNLTASQRLAVRWRHEDHRSVAKTTDWGLFGGEKQMRDNPEVSEGEMRALAATYSIDTRNDERNPTRGAWVSGMYEWAGEEFGGDFQYRKGVLDLRRYHEISRGFFADVRLSGGHLTQGKRFVDASLLGLERAQARIEGWGAYPVQELFYLGGVGTMRATQFKSLEGDRLLLANTEFRVQIFRDFQAAFFADVGDAWASSLRDPDIRTDAGIGFQDSDSSFRINFAKKMKPSDGEIFVSARIRRMF